MKILCSWIYRWKLFSLFILFLALILLPNFIFVFIDVQLDNKTIDFLDKLGLIPSLVLTILILPLWETIVFQTVIISICRALIKNKKRQFIVALSMSSLLFAGTHFYSIAYFLTGIYVGAIFVFAYYIALNKNISSTLFVFLIHATNNLISFLIG